jgi:hypothetical protein
MFAADHSVVAATKLAFHDHLLQFSMMFTVALPQASHILTAGTLVFMTTWSNLPPDAHEATRSGLTQSGHMAARLASRRVHAV